MISTWKCISHRTCQSSRKNTHIHISKRLQFNSWAECPAKHHSRTRLFKAHHHSFGLCLIYRLSQLQCAKIFTHDTTVNYPTLPPPYSRLGNYAQLKLFSVTVLTTALKVWRIYLIIKSCPWSGKKALQISKIQKLQLFPFLHCLCKYW